MTNLDSILNSRDITLPTKVHLVKVTVFSVVRYRCEKWTIKKAGHSRIDGFELWCWRLLRIPWIAKRSNQSILKEISPEYSLEGLMLKLKLQYFGHPMAKNWLIEMPWTAACQASLSFIISQSLLKLMSIESVMPSTHLIFYCPLLLLPSIIPSIRVFYNETFLCIRWPKYWSFSISPSNEYSGLISFRIDWLDLLAVQGTLKSVL